MNENIDLTKILKDCPKGTKFYSYIFGEETRFKGVSHHKGNPVPVSIYGKYGEDQEFCLSRKGHPHGDDYGECCIFPSKEQRDWSKFTAPWYKKEKFDPNTLKTFDRVLTRHLENERWDINFYSYINPNWPFPYACIDASYKYCIPYNDETKHLVGTTDEAPEYYRHWED